MDHFSLIKSQVEIARKQMLEITQDVSIPLDTRWELFCAAPMFLKKEEAFCSKLDDIFGKDVVMYEGPIHMERYQVMAAQDMVMQLEGNDCGPEVYSGIAAAKEKILALNLGNVTYDW